MACLRAQAHDSNLDQVQGIGVQVLPGIGIALRLLQQMVMAAGWEVHGLNAAGSRVILNI